MEKGMAADFANRATGIYRFQVLNYLDRKEYALAMMCLSNITTALNEIYKLYLKKNEDETDRRIVSLLVSLEDLGTELVLICRRKITLDENMADTLKKKINEVCDLLKIELNKILR